MTPWALKLEVTDHILYLYWIYSILPNLCIYSGQKKDTPVNIDHYFFSLIVFVIVTGWSPGNPRCLVIPRTSFSNIFFHQYTLQHAT